MKSWLDNLSVTRKLGLGFGVVLVLTAILATTGWTSLESVIQRSNWMSQINRLGDALTALRIARLQYMVANGDEKAAETVQGALDTYRSRHDEVRKSFVSPVNVRLLELQASQITDYQRSLNKMRQAYNAASQSRLAMTDSAVTVSNAIDAIEAAVLQLSSDDESRFPQFQSVIRAKDDWQMVRYQERGYTGNPTAESQRTVMAQLDEAQRAQAAFKAVFGLDHPQLVAQIDGAMEAYRAAVLAFIKANDDIVTARKEMTDQGQAIVGYDEQLTQIQLDRRDAESAQARSVQIIAALLAVLFGVLAAWIITRQITRPLRDTLGAVAGLQQGTQTVATIMQGSRAVTDTSVALSRKAGSALENITVRVSNIQSMNQQIAAAAEQQSAVAEEISRSVVNVRDISEQTATAGGEIARSSVELARLGGQLQAMVGHFRV